MKIKMTFLTLCAMLCVLCFSASAQQPAKVPRIGWLGSVPMPGVPERQEAFRRGLRELGYVEGKNIVIEWRSSEGILDRNSALAAELVNLKVDVIVSAAGSLTRAAKAATSTVPIVMAQDPDPVGNGFVASLLAQGGTSRDCPRSPELSGKKLEILKEVVPRLSRVAVFETSTIRDTTSKEIELAAQALKIKIQYLDVLAPADFETAFREAIKGRATQSL